MFLFYVQQTKSSNDNVKSAKEFIQSLLPIYDKNPKDKKLDIHEARKAIEFFLEKKIKEAKDGKEIDEFVEHHSSKVAVGLRAVKSLSEEEVKDEEEDFKISVESLLGALEEIKKSIIPPAKTESSEKKPDQADPDNSPPPHSEQAYKDINLSGLLHKSLLLTNPVVAIKFLGGGKVKPPATATPAPEVKASVNEPAASPAPEVKASAGEPAASPAPEVKASAGEPAPTGTAVEAAPTAKSTAPPPKKPLTQAQITAQKAAEDTVKKAAQEAAEKAAKEAVDSGVKVSRKPLQEAAEKAARKALGEAGKSGVRLESQAAKDIIQQASNNASKQALNNVVQKTCSESRRIGFLFRGMRQLAKIAGWLGIGLIALDLINDAKNGKDGDFKWNFGLTIGTGAVLFGCTAAAIALTSPVGLAALGTGALWSTACMSGLGGAGVGNFVNLLRKWGLFEPAKRFLNNTISDISNL